MTKAQRPDLSKHALPALYHRLTITQIFESEAADCAGPSQESSQAEAKGLVRNVALLSPRV
jgi:hypothetical protein